ncbi:MAG TPA: glycosyltransferase [Candidatus Saccharimonadales bacterium]|nr:glycosyltransferase [Candidatus Saccharimonadales bacterium]
MSESRDSRPVLSIVVPVYNEEDNIVPLVQAIHNALAMSAITYEIIFVDDHSEDKTVERIRALMGTSPVQLYAKEGVHGKAQSLIEGFGHIHGQYIAMIDGDLQYNPRYIPAMLKPLMDGTYDVMVANRKSLHDDSKLRRIASYSFRIIFGRLLWNMRMDIQSGLKVFRADILQRIAVDSKPWTFDLEFLLKAKNAGYKIGEVNIDFGVRTAGKTKLRVLSASYQIGKETMRLRFNPPNYIPFNKTDSPRDGFHYRGKAYEPYNQLNIHETAVHRFSTRQSIIGVFFALAIIIGLIFDFHAVFVIAIAALTTLYLGDLVLSLIMVTRSYYGIGAEAVTEDEIASRQSWPVYTIFCPLYKESAILSQFVSAMTKLEYPKNKLEVMLLLESDDIDTIAAARDMQLPHYFKIVVVPDSMPKTKPKACNYGLSLAKGEYAVIYDAEDIPDPLQLKKSVVVFKRSDSKIGCIQAKLNYYNWDQNILTRLFTLEYSLWFDLILPGLQSINAPIPLGGTSNHFRTSDLRKFGGWDPFNVTEDADLGIRLAKNGYSTLMLDSVTMEEANSHYRNWIRQRSRWIKGYIQTYFVHTRKMTIKQSRRNFSIFHLIIGGKVLSSLINPILWLLTISYFLFDHKVGSYIHSLYSPVVLYIGIIALIVGNFLYLYMYMLGAAKRNHSELIIAALLVPFYWLMISIATPKAIKEFITKPFHWQKTIHGLHLAHMRLEIDDTHSLANVEAE